jgi:RNA polymerase sigma-70 factor (ECF subfamily)
VNNWPIRLVYGVGGIGVVGDQSQLMRALYDQHGHAQLAYAMCLTGDYSGAQDLVRESMLRACRTPGLLDQSEGSARAWLFTAARHIAIDGWRSGRSRQEIPTDVPEAEILSELEAALRSWQIAEALLRLSAQHRQALVECYYCGRTVAEVAAMLGVPEGTIMSRLHFGLRAVRLVLAEMGVEDSG